MVESTRMNAFLRNYAKLIEWLKGGMYVPMNELKNNEWRINGPLNVLINKWMMCRD